MVSELFPLSGMLHKITARSLYRSLAQLIVVFGLFSLYTPAYAACTSGPCTFFNGSCTGGANPVAVTNCTGGMCAVCAPANSSDAWANPQLEVMSMPTTYTWTGIGALKMPIYKAKIMSSKCQWLLGIRFCVRVAKPQIPATTTSPAIPGDPGNETGSKPRVCAYEDPCDGMDPPDGNCFGNLSSPYHAGTSHASGATALQKTYNQVVLTTVGCVDRPIGPLPPAWKNSAWFQNSDPLPVFSDATGSVFESPKVQMKQCKNSSGVKVFCTVISGAAREGAIEIVPNPILNPNSTNGYKDCSDDNGNHVTSSGTTSGSIYCAAVNTDTPDTITLTMLGANAQDWINIGTMPRPGYMPKPTVVATAGSLTSAPKIDVTLRGKTVTLEDDPGLYLATPTPTPNWDMTRTCKLIHQVMYCIGRPCQPGSTVTTTQVVNGVSVTSMSCTYQNMVCAKGYSTAPGVAVNAINATTITNSTADKPLTTLPNTKITANTLFVNSSTANNPENGAVLKEKFSKDVWVLPPGQPSCKMRSSDAVGSYCQNYYGTCTNGSNPCTNYAIENASAAADLWYVNGTTQVKRPMNEFEAGLCIYSPPDMTATTYKTNGTYNYSIPKNCSKVSVKLWGAGASGGYHAGNTDVWDASGGAGGYIEDTINVNDSQKFAVVVGKGGAAVASGNSADAKDGGDTQITLTNGWYWKANGGTNIRNNSGSYGGGASSSPVSSTAVIHNGGNGGGANGTSAGGGLAYNSTAQPASLCPYHGGYKGTYTAPMGGGGCAGDDTPGSWGRGGDGQVIIQCVKGMDQ